MCFSDGSLLEEGSVLRAAAGRSVQCVTLSWLSFLLFTSILLFFYPLFSFTSPSFTIYSIPSIVSSSLSVFFLLYNSATDGLICMVLDLFFFHSLSISLCLFLNSLSLSSFMPPGPFSIFWVNLPSSLDHYLLFIYCFLLLFPLQLPFSFVSPPFTPTLSSRSLSLSTFRLSVCHSP